MRAMHQTPHARTEINIIAIVTRHMLNMGGHAGIASLQKTPSFGAVLPALVCHGLCLLVQVRMQLGVAQLAVGAGSRTACAVKCPSLTVPLDKAEVRSTLQQGQEQKLHACFATGASERDGVTPELTYAGEHTYRKQ